MPETTFSLLAFDTCQELLDAAGIQETRLSQRYLDLHQGDMHALSKVHKMTDRDSLRTAIIDRLRAAYVLGRMGPEQRVFRQIAIFQYLHDTEWHYQDPLNMEFWGHVGPELSDVPESRREHVVAALMQLLPQEEPAAAE